MQQENENIIKLETEDDITIISFTTPTISCLCHVEEVAADVRTFIDRQKPRRIIVDFTGVKFFSSQVLGMLVDIWKRLNKIDGRVVISGINPDLSRVFKITNLDTIFEFRPDRISALETLKKT